MSLIVQMCIVIVTIAVVAMAFVAIRIMLQFKATAKRLEASYSYLQEILEESRETSRKVRELMTTLEQIALTVRGGATRVAQVVNRATVLGAIVLEEVEEPVFKAVVVMRALRAGIGSLARRWTHSCQPVGFSPEGANHVREQ